MPRRMRPLGREHIGLLPRPCMGCVYWETGERLPLRCGARCDEDELGGWIEYVGAQWGDSGRVAVDGEDVLGFIKYAPAGFFPQARYQLVGPPSDDAVLMACLHVTDQARHRGLGKLLLHAALRDLFLRGERAVEAYAMTEPPPESPVVSLEFLLKQGFVVERPHPRMPLVRLNIKSLAAVTENIESVLDTLQIPLRVHNRRPAPYS